MDRAELKKKVRNLTVWKKGQERAPHKPLLVLYAIGMKLSEGKRLIPYRDVDEQLKKLLAEFGPYRSNYRTAYPFWRLQNDNIWEVQSTKKISENISGDVSKKDLLNSDSVGGFNEEVFNELKKNPKLVHDIINELLNSNFPETIHKDILDAVGIHIKGRKLVTRYRNPEFREKVLRAYEYECAICGFNVRLDHYPVALEAAHIKWFQAGGPDKECNGLALCALHHKLFDRGALTLSKDLKVLVSDHAYGTQGFHEWLGNFRGKKIKIPRRKIYFPEHNFRHWHVREVFNGYPD